MNTQQDYLIQRLNFDVFVDQRSGLLKDDLGRFNRNDFIHLGSSGIILLIKLIKVRVCGNRVDGRPYSSLNGTVRSERSRENGMNMMRAPTTTSNEFPALSQPSES